MSANSSLKWIQKLVIIVIISVFFTIATAAISSEGEIKIVDNVQHHGYLKQDHRMKRAATSRKDLIWDFGVISYVIDPIFTAKQKAGFVKAMKHWERHTCIKFVERNSNEHVNFIRFTVLECGCCSKVGKRNTGEQTVSIGPGCHIFGKILHELGHTIGFFHEHKRPDRDNYVKIHTENIKRNQTRNFDILSEKDVESFGEPYDPTSIMHYGKKVHSENGRIVIEWLKGSISNMGQKKQLSRSDIIQTNLLYNCPKCGQTFLSPMATFTSPNYYNSTGNRSFQCEWRISITQGDRIRLEIGNVEIFNSTDCENDYLEIRDGYWHKSPLLGRYSGNITNLSPVMSTSNRLTLTYQSMHPEYRGFTANYEVIDGIIPTSREDSMIDENSTNDELFTEENTETTD